MGKTIYNLLIFGYSIAIWLASLFNRKAKQWLKGREGIFHKLEVAFRGNEQKIAWFHCASLGEFEQGRPLLERFKIEYPYYKILLTFFSPSGYEIRKNYSKADYIFYLPLDTPTQARKFLKVVKPEIVFFIKYEFWYNYLSEIAKSKIPLISVSAIFREEQLFFKKYGTFYVHLLKMFNHIFVQNEPSKNLLQSVGIKDVTVAGDTRFDRVKEISSSSPDILLIEKFKNKIPLLVAGSIWKEDLEIVLPFINTFPQPLKCIIAPHEINPAEIDNLLDSITKKAIKFSQASFETVHNYDVLIIDNVGMLSSIYKYGNFAFIGGGFGKGIHNILEAVVHGVPVFFGPNYLKFKEAVELVNLKSAFTVNSTSQFEALFSSLYYDSKKREEIKKISEGYIEANIGATDKIINFCKALITQ